MTQGDGSIDTRGRFYCVPVSQGDGSPVLTDKAIYAIILLR